MRKTEFLSKKNNTYQFLKTVSMYSSAITTQGTLPTIQS